MTQFSLTDDYNDFGQPASQTTVAMPRRADKRARWHVAVNRSVNPDETNILATHSFTTYAVPPDGTYLRNRVAQTKFFELADPPGPPDGPGDSAQTALRQQWAEAQRVRDVFRTHPGARRVLNHTVNHYDGPPFLGEPAGVLGSYGALVRTETLVLTEELLKDAYDEPQASSRPDSLPAAAPRGFVSSTGYRKENADNGFEAGWYADTERQQYDFHSGPEPPRGLVTARRDALGHDTHLAYDAHALLPEKVTDAGGLETTAVYNYRVLKPESLTDPNGTSTHMHYTPIGLPLKQFVRGTDARGNETLGGTEDKPEISFFYDFLHFERLGKPIYVHTSRRLHHASDHLSDDTIETREYSDGYGRLLQTRTQAEDWIFGKAGDDVGLPGQANVDPGPAVARQAAHRVLVSGWQVYDNKGQIIEKYEPFFSTDWEFEPEAEARRGQHATLFYDPRGNVIRTVNPDGSQQRVILGRPLTAAVLELSQADLESSDGPDSFEPAPWETYTYDGNDLASLTHPGAALAPAGHYFTPASGLTDALGRVLCQVHRNGRDPQQDWFITCITYDLRGNPLKIIDSLNREAFQHAYDERAFRLARLRSERFSGVKRGTSSLYLTFPANGNRLVLDDLDLLLEKCLILTYYLRFAAIPVRLAQAHLSLGEYAIAVDLLHVLYDEVPDNREDRPIYPFFDQPYVNLPVEAGADAAAQRLRLGEAYLRWAEMRFRQNTEASRYEARRLYERVLRVHAVADCDCLEEYTRAAGHVFNLMRHGGSARQALPMAREVLRLDGVVKLDEVNRSPTLAAVGRALQQDADDRRAKVNAEGTAAKLRAKGAARINAAELAMARMQWLSGAPLTTRYLEGAELARTMVFRRTGPISLPRVSLCTPENPLLVAQIREACLRLDLLHNCLNILGYRDSLIPPLRFEALVRIAASFTDLAHAAEQDVMSFRQSFEQETYSLHAGRGQRPAG